METRLKVIIILLVFITASNVGAQLTDEEMIKLERGEILIESRSVDNAPWPEMYAKVLISGRPEDCASVFAAYHHQKQYVPNVIKSEPIKFIAPNDIHMSYEMHMPWPLPNTHYVTGNVFTKLNEDSYQVRWYWVESDSTKDTKGTAIFSSYKNKTLFSYQTLVWPDSIFAGLLKGKMKSDLTETLKAIVTHINLTIKNPAQIEQYKKLVSMQLKGEYIYPEIAPAP